MQTLDQPLVVSGYRGNHITADTNRLVAGMATVYTVRSVDDDGEPAPPSGIDDVETWRFVMAADWDPATAPCYVTEEVSYDAVRAAWTIELEGTRTAQMVEAFDSSGQMQIGCEIAGIPAGGDWAHPSYVLQWDAVILSRRDSGQAPTPDDAGDANVRVLDASAAIKAPEIRLYDAARSAWVTITVESGQIIVR